jgi:ADP-ribosylglycohydrolase
MLGRLVRLTRPISDEFTTKLAQVPDLIDWEPEAAYEVLGEGWVAEEAVAYALYAFWRSPYDYRRTVITAVNMDGDSDSVGCIAGAISGAYNGLEGIPEKWRRRVEETELLHYIASDLLDANQRMRG